MSHSEALSRLTVGDRSCDPITCVLRRAIGTFERGAELHDMIDARIHPTVKYALSHDQPCTRIAVDGTTVTFDDGRARAADAVRTA